MSENAVIVDHYHDEAITAVAVAAFERTSFSVHLLALPFKTLIQQASFSQLMRPGLFLLSAPSPPSRWRPLPPYPQARHGPAACARQGGCGWVGSSPGPSAGSTRGTAYGWQSLGCPGLRSGNRSICTASRGCRRSCGRMAAMHSRCVLQWVSNVSRATL